MTVKEALADGRRRLIEGGIEDAHFEAEVLLREVLLMTRSQFYIDLERELSEDQVTAYRRLIERRLGAEPTAYIMGRREFYGRVFMVNQNVLVPRPETELLVEKALDIALDYVAPSVADVGTGCGAIAITLALEIPEATIYATDNSAPALRVARANCRKFDVTDRVFLLRGNLLDVTPLPVDIIVANLPYIREADIPRSGPVSAEPRMALDGGIDGLEHIRQLCRQAGSKLRPRGHLLLEVGQGQAGVVTILLRNLFPSARIETIQDLAGIDRVVSLSLSS